MAAIVSILNSKGGSGKTTLTINLAHALVLNGHSVLIADSDAQGSVRDWRKMRGQRISEDHGIFVVGMDRTEVIPDIKRLASNFDYVLIDGAAKLKEMDAACIKLSDAVLLPVQASQLDLWGVYELVETIKARHTITEGRPAAAYVMTRIDERTRLAKELPKVIGEQLPLFKHYVADRTIYKTSIGLGETVFDFKTVLPSEAKAKAKAMREIQGVRQELDMLLNTRNGVVS